MLFYKLENLSYNYDKEGPVSLSQKIETRGEISNKNRKDTIKTTFFNNYSSLN